MVQIGSGVDDPTGAQNDVPQSRLEKARERGRERAVEVLTEEIEDDSLASDGGISADALRLAASRPDLDPEQIVAYDHGTTMFRENGGPDLPVRGPDGDVLGNLERSVMLAEYRAAIAEYRRLTG